MRGSCWRLAAMLLTLLASGHSTSSRPKTQHQPSVTHNVTAAREQRPPLTTVKPHLTTDPPERWRRSASNSMLEQRAALLGKSDPLTYFIPARGRRSWQTLKQLTSAEETPFWAARGRRGGVQAPEITFWPARGKKKTSETISSLKGRNLLGLGENNPLWATRGKKLIQTLESEEDNPFWAARGKKLSQLLESSENPFWAARGKKFENDPREIKLLLESSENPFWAARGKKLSELLESDENPFWAARGKKLSELLESDENPFWAARGKKLSELLESDENPFWAARGKKLSELLESDENPFWAARGKKLSELLESDENPFWAARGKKLSELLESDENPFWAARGKKLSELLESDENPFWAARGKKLSELFEAPFYVPRGKKSEDKEVSLFKESPLRASQDRRPSLHTLLNTPAEAKERAESNGIQPIMRPRESRQGETVNVGQFWPARGKRLHGNARGNYDDEEFNKEDEIFWQKLENKTSLLGQQNMNNNLNIIDILSQLFGIPIKKSIQKEKKKNFKELILNPNYSTNFWSARG